MSEQITTKDHVFAKIIRHEIPSNIVFEDDEIIAFHDVMPAAPKHILVIPKRDIESAAKATEDDALILGKMILRAAAIAKEIGESENGYRLVINTGAAGGQTVPHIHIHLLAGRNMTWPPG